VSALSTDVDFDDVRVAVEQQVVTATLGNFATPRFGWSIGAGAVVGGTIAGRDVAGGATLGGTLTWLPVYESKRRPFVGFTTSLGVAIVRANDDTNQTRSWSAIDIRGGVMAGKTFGRLVPYVAARAFGGPVIWRSAGERVVGFDRYHLTLGGGLVIRLPRNFNVTLEAMPLGEQSLAAGTTVQL
jgi:hypothetical protein